MDMKINYIGMWATIIVIAAVMGCICIVISKLYKLNKKSDKSGNTNQRLEATKKLNGSDVKTYTKEFRND